MPYDYHKRTLCIQARVREVINSSLDSEFERRMKLFANHNVMKPGQRLGKVGAYLGPVGLLAVKEEKLSKLDVEAALIGATSAGIMVKEIANATFALIAIRTIPETLERMAALGCSPDEAARMLAEVVEGRAARTRGEVWRIAGPLDCHPAAPPSDEELEVELAYVSAPLRPEHFKDSSRKTGVDAASFRLFSKVNTERERGKGGKFRTPAANFQKPLDTPPAGGE